MWIIFPLLILAVLGMFFYGLYAFLIKRKKSNDEPHISYSTIKIPRNLLWAILLLVLSFNVLVYNTHFGLGIGLFFALTALAMYFTFPPERRTRLIQLVLFGVAITSIMVGFRANGFVQGLNIAVSAIFLLLAIGIHATTVVHWKGLWLIGLFSKVFTVGIGNIPGLLRNSAQQEPESTESSGTSKSPVIQIVKISVLTLLLVIFFAALLSAADPVFADLIGDLLDQAIGRVIISLIIAIIAIVALTVEATEHLKEYRPSVRWFSFSEVIIPVFAVAVLFGFFLFVQAKYLFGAHADLATFGLTYSQYVRRGFVELLVTTSIGGLLVYGVYLKQSVTEIKNHIIGYKLVNSVIIAELFLMLISALKRDFLYVEMFGITRTRIIGGIFILCLGVLLLSLLLLILVEKMKEKHLFLMLGCASVFVVGSLNLINIDRVIARAQAPSNTFKDYFYINSLSEDAYDGWKESIPVVLDFYENMYTNPTPEINEIEQFTNYKLAMVALQEKRQNLVNKYAPAGNESETPVRYNAQFAERERAIGSFNFSELRAFNAMMSEQELFFTRTDCLITQMARYQQFYKIDTYSLEIERLYDYDYPFVNTQRGYYPNTGIVRSDDGRDRLIPPTSCLE